MNVDVFEWIIINFNYSRLLVDWEQLILGEKQLDANSS